MVHIAWKGETWVSGRIHPAIYVIDEGADESHLGIIHTTGNTGEEGMRSMTEPPPEHMQSRDTTEPGVGTYGSHGERRTEGN